ELHGAISGGSRAHLVRLPQRALRREREKRCWAASTTARGLFRKSGRRQCRRLEGLSTMREPPKTMWMWLDSRLGLAPFVEMAREKKIPLHRHSIWYYFGGMTLFLFMVQVITGMLLLLYYRPSAEGAFESVQFIMGEVRFGWLVRS